MPSSSKKGGSNRQKRRGRSAAAPSPVQPNAPAPQGLATSPATSPPQLAATPATSSTAAPARQPHPSSIRGAPPGPATTPATPLHATPAGKPPPSSKKAAPAGKPDRSAQSKADAQSDGVLSSKGDSEHDSNSADPSLSRLNLSAACIRTSFQQNQDQTQAATQAETTRLLLSSFSSWATAYMAGGILGEGYDASRQETLNVLLRYQGSLPEADAHSFGDCLTPPPIPIEPLRPLVNDTKDGSNLARRIIPPLSLEVDDYIAKFGVDHILQGSFGPPQQRIFLKILSEHIASSGISAAQALHQTFEGRVLSQGHSFFQGGFLRPKNGKAPHQRLRLPDLTNIDLTSTMSPAAALLPTLTDQDTAHWNMRRVILDETVYHAMQELSELGSELIRTQQSSISVHAWQEAQVWVSVQEVLVKLLALHVQAISQIYPATIWTKSFFDSWVSHSSAHAFLSADPACPPTMATTAIVQNHGYKVYSGQLAYSVLQLMFTQHGSAMSQQLLKLFYSIEYVGQGALACWHQMEDAFKEARANCSPLPGSSDDFHPALHPLVLGDQFISSLNTRAQDPDSLMPQPDKTAVLKLYRDFRAFQYPSSEALRAKIYKLCSESFLQPEPNYGIGQQGQAALGAVQPPPSQRSLDRLGLTLTLQEYKPLLAAFRAKIGEDLFLKHFKAVTLKDCGTSSGKSYKYDKRVGQIEHATYMTFSDDTKDMFYRLMGATKLSSPCSIDPVGAASFDETKPPRAKQTSKPAKQARPDNRAKSVAEREAVFVAAQAAQEEKEVDMQKGLDDLKKQNEELQAAIKEAASKASAAPPPPPPPPWQQQQQQQIMQQQHHQMLMQQQQQQQQQQSLYAAQQADGGGQNTFGLGAIAPGTFGYNFGQGGGGGGGYGHGSSGNGGGAFGQGF